MVIDCRLVMSGFDGLVICESSKVNEKPEAGEEDDGNEEVSGNFKPE